MNLEKRSKQIYGYILSKKDNLTDPSGVSNRNLKINLSHSTLAWARDYTSFGHPLKCWDFNKRPLCYLIYIFKETMHMSKNIPRYTIFYLLDNITIQNIDFILFLIELWFPYSTETIFDMSSIGFDKENYLLDLIVTCLFII